MTSSWSTSEIAGFNIHAVTATIKSCGTDAPLIVISRHIDEANTAELLRAGAADVIRKEHIDTRLGTVVARELAAAAARREARSLQQFNHRLFETSLDLILVTDRRGTFVRANPISQEILGYRPDEMVGHSAEAFIHPADLENTRNEMRQGRLGRLTRRFECRYLHKDGRIVTLDWTGVWAEPEQQHFFIGRDVTERQETARKLRESEGRLALAIEIAQIGLARAPNASLPTQTDAQFNRIYGRLLDTAEMTAGEWLRQMHPEDREQASTQLLTTLRQGGVLRGDFRIRRADTGEERWVRTVMRATDSSSEFFGVHADITDHKRALEEQRRSTEQLNRAQQVANIGSALYDLMTDQVEWSDQTYRIFGLTRGIDTPSLKLLSDMVHPDDRAKFRSGVGLARLDQAQQPVEYRIIRPDGATRLIRRESEIVRDADGNPRQIAGTLQDVTEQRQIEAHLHQAQKMEALGNMTGGMAHDFNNILGVIIGSLGLAAPLVADNDEAVELLKEATDAARSAAELTRRLLAFARQQPLRPGRIDVNELITHVVRLLRRILGENVEIALNLAEDLWPVVADAAQLEASITNLAANARDAMPNGGRLSISTANRYLDAEYAAHHADVAPGYYATIEVTDTGAGMTSEIVQRIFEPFFTTKEPGKGTGLGLSMVFGFIKQSDGHINIYSEPGIGTTFRLYLPRMADAAVQPDSTAPAALHHGRGQTVLLVEDNPQLRRVVSRQLKELGYRALDTDGAQAAIALLEQEPVDLVFSDVVMPGPIDGMALARLVFERWPGVKVLLTSGFPGTRIDERLGVYAARVRLLSKPYNIDELARVVHEALDGSSAAGGKHGQDPGD